MKSDIDRLVRHPSRRGTAPPRPSAALIELTRLHGPLQPVLVRRLGTGCFEILGGIENWLAAQACGYHQVPIEVLEGLDEAAALEVLESTDHRPRPLDTARLYGRLVEAERAIKPWGATSRVAQRCRVGRTVVARALRVIALPPTFLKAIDGGALSVGHAYALLACRDDEIRANLATRAIRERLSVRALERLVRGERDRRRGEVGTGPEKRSADVVRLERLLTDHLGSTVTIDEGGGRLIVDFGGSLEVFEGVLERIGLAQA